MNSHSGGNGVFRDLALQRHGYAFACHVIEMMLVLGKNLLMLLKVVVRASKMVE